MVSFSKIPTNYPTFLHSALTFYLSILFQSSFWIIPIYLLQESFPTPLFLDALLLVQMARQGKSGAHQRVNLSLKTAVSRKAQVRCFTVILILLFKLQLHLAKHCFLLIIYGNLLILLLKSLLILVWI